MTNQKVYIKQSKILGRRLLCCLPLISSAAVADINLMDKDGAKIDFKLELQGAVFANKNSNFGESKSFLGADTDNWQEAAVEAGFAGEYPLAQGTIFAEVSLIGTVTFGDDASGFTVDESPSEFKIEQGHIGWRSGNTFSSLGEDAVTIQGGAFDYMIGTGLLIADGGSDGGDRGAWWIGARKTFKSSFLAKLETGPLLAETFYLENSARTGANEGRAYGVNAEYEFSSAGVKSGFTWFDVAARGRTTGPGYDVISLRGDWSPVENLTFSGEYVTQDVDDGADPEGWYLKGAYQLAETTWQPEFSYRYATFDGDDLNTAKDESFRGAAYGFSDYGSWYQGEIAGNYPLDNSNLQSHLLRLQLFPNNDLTLNVLVYHFKLNEKNIFGTPVTSDHFGDELNLSVDWAVNDNLFVIGTLGLLVPGRAAKDYTGGDKNWVYSMLYMSYTF